MRGNPTPDVFDYIACKFIMNLPKEELSQQRIGFHFEKAYFYYLDSHGLAPLAFNRNKNDKSKQPKQIVNFCNQLLRVVSCAQLPRLTGNQIVQLIQQNYSSISISGIIILNQQQTKAVVVQSKGNNIYGFPKGKINEGESFQQCAVRQVKQEIGLKLDVDSNFYIDIDQYSKVNGKSLTKKCRFYICKVDQSCIVGRKSQIKNDQSLRDIIHSVSEIGSIQWLKLSEIAKLIDKQLVNTPSRLAHFQLIKKLNKNLSYKQKKSINPLEQFKGFDKNLGMLFLK